MSVLPCLMTVPDLLSNIIVGHLPLLFSCANDSEDLSIEDIQHCTPRYWDLMTEPILAFDNAMFTIIAAHVGLAVGSLSRYSKTRPDLKPLITRLLRLETVGIFLLSERGHGLDAFNIETTATKVDDGYIFHTPREEAAK